MNTPKTVMILIFTVCFFGSSAMAQSGKSLLFTTLNTEHKLNPAGGTSLVEIDPQDVMYVTPNPSFTFSAENYAPNAAWHVLAGDVNANGVYGEHRLTRCTDALLVGDPLNPWPFKPHPTMRELSISPARRVEGNVDPMGHVLMRADVARLIPDGEWGYFLRADHIVQAFGLTELPRQINVDAIAFKDDPDPAKRMIYFSLEEDRTITIDYPAPGSVYHVPDGSILAIPGPSVLSWNSLGIDGGVVPNSGRVVAMESQVNDIVRNASVSNSGGGPVMYIGDLDGLELDPKGSKFQGKMGWFDNLWFSGENLTCCGIVTTRSGGAIPSLNGVLLATPYGMGATTGAQVGVCYTNMGSLNGLDLIDELHCSSVVDCDDRVIDPGDMINIEFSGASPTYTGLIICLGPTAEAGVAISVPISIGHCFPEHFIFPTYLALYDVTSEIDAGGFGFFISSVYPGGLSGLTFLFQTYSVDGSGPRLSTPMMVELQ